MTEYVFEIIEREITYDGCEHQANYDIERRENIVRCKDCAHAHEGARYCDRFTSCGLGDFVDIEPDGFCAWGRRGKSA